MKESDEFKFDETNLDKYIMDMKKDDIVIPEELETRIQARISTLKRPIPKYKYVIAASIALCLIMAAMIRFSPVVASYAAEIPGLESAVAWLRGDSGIINAQKHGYGGISPATIEQDGYKLEIADIFFDEDRLRFSAVVSGPEITEMLAEKQKSSESKQVEEELPAKDRNNDIHLEFSFSDFNIEGYVMSTFTSGQEQNVECLAYDVEKSFDPGETSDFVKKASNVINIGAKLMRGKEEIIAFENIQLSFDASKFIYSKIYNQNKHIVLKHTEINIDKFVVSPTRMKVYIKTCMEDGYTFNSFENPYLKDDKGNIYKSGSIIGRGDPNDLTLYFVPSTYFDKLADKLYFCFDGIRIASSEGKSFTLGMDEKLPKKLLYMGKEIKITELTWNEIGKLGVKLVLPDDGILRMQGLCIVDNGVKTGADTSQSWTGSTLASSIMTDIYCTFEVEKRQVYNMEFDYPGYLIPTETELELDLEK